MAAVPDEPREWHGARCPAAGPPSAVHHRQAIAEHMNAREPLAFQQVCPAYAFIERKTEEQDHARAELEAMGSESRRILERGVCENGIGRRDGGFQEVDS